MKKRIYLLAWGALVLSAAMFLAPPVAAQNANGNKDQIIKAFPLDGLYVERPADEFITPSVMGIQKTINIPAAAFNDDRDTAFGSWFNGWGSYLSGQSSNYTYLQAPVIFPKGAKKIAKIDILMWNSTASSWLYFYAIPFSSASHLTLYSHTFGAYSAWMDYSYVWAKGTEPQLQPMNAYYMGICINNTNRLKSVIITYK
jgi:hypothetical protein